MSAKYILIGAIVASAVSLVACSGGQAPASQTPSGQTPKTSPADAVAVPNTVSTALAVTPDTVDGCKPTQPVVATVKWHTTEPRVKVMVAAPGQVTLQLFAESGHAGSAQTGDWVVANTRFELVDAVNNKQLSRVVVGATVCK